MGYCSKIFLVQDSKMKHNESDKRYAEVIAMFDLGSTSYFLSRIFKDPSPCFFYDPCDGNRKITHDDYGDECTCCGTREFYDYIMEHHGDWEPWVKIAKAVRLIREGRPDCILIHYGH